MTHVGNEMEMLVTTDELSDSTEDENNLLSTQNFNCPVCPFSCDDYKLLEAHTETHFEQIEVAEVCCCYLFQLLARRTVSQIHSYTLI